MGECRRVERNRFSNFMWKIGGYMQRVSPCMAVIAFDLFWGGGGLGPLNDGRRGRLQVSRIESILERFMEEWRLCSVVQSGRNSL